MKMGYALIAVGILLAVAGIVIVAKNKKADEKPRITLQELASAPAEPDAGNNEEPAAHEEAANKPELSAKEKGNAFESYVADLLKGSGIKIKQWNQGTVTEGGAMGENALNPDFFVEQPYGKSSLEYWLECKWRRDLPGDKYSFPPSQFDRYKKTQHDSKRKVFVVFGIGGEPDAPRSVYIMPLDSMSECTVSLDAMRPFYYSEPGTQLVPRISKYFREEIFKRR